MPGCFEKNAASAKESPALSARSHGSQENLTQHSGRTTDTRAGPETTPECGIRAGSRQEEAGLAKLDLGVEVKSETHIPVLRSCYVEQRLHLLCSSRVSEVGFNSLGGRLF